MAFGAKRFTVGLELSYTVDAESADAALRAVLPMVRDAESVAYKIREETARPIAISEAHAKPYAELTKSVYKVNEVAAILGISRNAVYERVPCIRVGSRRLYPRATIVDVLQNGLKREEAPVRELRRPRRRAAPAPARIVKKSPPLGAAAELPKRLTMKDAAAMLRLSYSKAKELFDSRKIYSADSYGKRLISRDAVEHYLKGRTAREFAEMLIDRAKSDPYYKDKQETVEDFAREMRDKWAN